MKDHFQLHSKQNILRQALLDVVTSNDPHTLQGLIDWQISTGTTIERLAVFAKRRLGVKYVDALSAICILVPDRLN